MRTIAGQYLLWHRGKEQGGKKEELLKNAASIEPWGFDCMRYEFKDGSFLVYDKLTKEWML